MVEGLEDEHDCLLHSTSIYYDFENSFYAPDNSEKCSSIKTQFGEYAWFPPICDKISKYASDIKEYSSEVMDEECTNLYCWLYDNVFKGVGEKEVEYNKIISGLEEVVKQIIDTQKFSEIQKCFPNSFGNKINEMKIKKKIYNYLNFRQFVRTEYHKAQSNCKKFYCKHIDSFIESHQQIKSLCSPYDEKTSSQFCKDYIKNDPISMTIMLGCKQKSELPEFYEKHGISIGHRDTESPLPFVPRMDGENGDLRDPDIIHDYK
ncbi:Plasmodium vivax Vir protein, putative [Plasmodium ovale]|uniref:Plasmodium vivax Vir protein, putative n=1 Tax=Plasmodium ovale TaxID=36330 RepID=A0A1C3KEV2_PLAOA|nr:Plasmodium vivax Vir protein, putative [Plasmodium ovale]